MVANPNGKDISSIISTTNERFKLTLNKADWPLKKKKDLLVQANSLRIIEHLEGTAEAPGEPPNNNLSTRRYYDEKENKFKTLSAVAWQFVYEITNETPLQDLIIPFEETRNVSGAWQAIVNYYEVDAGGATRHSLLQRLEHIVPNPNHTDLRLQFNYIVSQVEQIVTALRHLPGTQQLVMDSNSKKHALMKILANNCSGIFDDIMKNPATNVDAYLDYVQAIEKLIIHETITRQLKNPTAASVKLSNEKKESRQVFQLSKQQLMKQSFPRKTSRHSKFISTKTLVV